MEGTAAVVAAGVFASAALVLRESAGAHVVLLAVMPRGERCACQQQAVAAAASPGLQQFDGRSPLHPVRLLAGLLCEHCF